MATEALLRDCSLAIESKFGAMAVFSCITGGSAEKFAKSPNSDIDLVIVLRDHVDLTCALTVRALFTRSYLKLHRDYGCTPDLQWPGEVLYLRDLDDALRGATFERAVQLNGAPTLCADDQPYRYWISMIATGIPLTGIDMFGVYAEACASLLADHATAVLATENTDSERYWAENWHLPVPCGRGRTWRIARHTRAAGTSVPGQSSLRPYQPTTSPQLEHYAGSWSRIARQDAVSLTEPFPPGASLRG